MAAFFASLVVIGLFFWTKYYQPIVLADNFQLSIGLIPTVMFGVVAITSIVFFFLDLQKAVIPSIITIYYLSFLATILLIVSNDYAASPFMIYLIILTIFAMPLSIWGLIPATTTIGVYASVQYVSGDLGATEIMNVVVYGVFPLLSSMLLFNTIKSEHDKNSNDEKAYKNLASELHAVADESEVVINAIGDGVLAIDGQGVVQLINPAAQSIVGWGKQDATYLNYKSILQMVDENNEPIDPTKDPIQQALNLNQEIRATANILTNSGKGLIVSIVVSPAGQAGSGVIAVFRDITKEKAEEREQAEFISTASHEMRTPVASIEGYLGLALNPQTAQVDEKAREFINKAQESAKHLGHLFQDLLDVSKADDGRISNDPRVMNLVTFTDEIAQGLAPKASEKGLSFVFKPTSGVIKERRLAPVYFVNLDSDHVREILDNLIENAIKYTPKGEVVVDVQGNEENVVVSIKDSGIGIPAEDIPHLFQKFYRVDNESTREIGGTGLGLYLCRRLAELMGGRIWVESTYGKGSTFYLELPRVSNEDASRLKEQEEFQAKQQAAMISNSAAPSPQAPQPTVAQPTMQPTLNAPRPAAPQQPAQIPVTAPVAMGQPVTQPMQQPRITTPTAQVPTRPAVPAPARPGQSPVINQATARKATPRSSSLTPEQIAAYVARQRQRAQEEANKQGPTT